MSGRGRASLGPWRLLEVKAGVCGAPCGDRRLCLGVGGRRWAPGGSWRSRPGCEGLSAGKGVCVWAWEGITGPLEAPGGQGLGVWGSLRGKEAVSGRGRASLCPWSTKKHTEYQGQGEKDRVPGARSQKRSTRGTKNRVRIFPSVSTVGGEPRPRTLGELWFTSNG